MRKQYDNDVIIIVTAFSNEMNIIFIDLFDDTCVKLSVCQIIALIFKHILTFLLIIIDHKYDFTLVISLYIKFSSCF